MHSLQAQWKQCHSNGADLEDVLLEVQRLWPPFAGGFRVSRKVHYFANNTAAKHCCK